jgi:hypothetical protein
MGDVDIFYCNAVYCRTITYISLLFGIFLCYLAYFFVILYNSLLLRIFSTFWYVEARKIWQPWLTRWLVGKCSLPGCKETK